MYTCTSICTSPTHVHALQQHLLNLWFKKPFSEVKNYHTPSPLKCFG